jgi:hypothetical protein
MPFVSASVCVRLTPIIVCSTSLFSVIILIVQSAGRCSFQVSVQGLPVILIFPFWMSARSVQCSAKWRYVMCFRYIPFPHWAQYTRPSVCFRAFYSDILYAYFFDISVLVPLSFLFISDPFSSQEESSSSNIISLSICCYVSIWCFGAGFFGYSPGLRTYGVMPLWVRF